MDKETLNEVVENSDENVENKNEVTETDDSANISDAEKIEWLQEELAKVKKENETNVAKIASLKEEYKKAFLTSPVKSSDVEADSDEFDEDMFKGSKESKLPDKKKDKEFKPIWK